MNQLAPTIAQVFAPYFSTPRENPPPTICRRCDDVIDVDAHTLDDCEEVQQQAAIDADLAYNRDKAHRKNNEDFVRGMKLQMQQMDAGVLA